MTIGEALKISKETGATFSRHGSGDWPLGYGGWIKYDPTHIYKYLTAVDLMADDWEQDGKETEPKKL